LTEREDSYIAGTILGGKAAAATNVAKYGASFYHNIGKLGGSKKVPKGFAKMDKEKVREAGRKGGSVRWKHSPEQVEETVKKSWVQKLRGN